MNILQKRTQLIQSHTYQQIEYSQYDYKILQDIPVKREQGKRRREYNDIIIMGDTETSKKYNDGRIYDNHVCAWSISMRSHGHNLATLYGRKPSEMVDCINRIREALQGEYTFIYFHNLAYDWVFLRKFYIKEWGPPDQQLNVKSHYPINIVFDNGLIFRDSLILAQVKLEKWAADYNVEHQKAVGKWDYDKIRNQDTPLTPDEILYVCNDTLAGVECIEALMLELNKKIFSIPYTATGIPRDITRKIGKKHHAHDRFKGMCLSWEYLLRCEQAYHGGYVHANRHYLSRVLDEETDGLIQCYDFASSYPFIMLCFPMPMEKFTPLDKNYGSSEIIAASDKYAFIFKLILINPRLKSDDIVMPVLQYYKCTRILNPIIDNGRVLKADYLEIEITEIDLKLILQEYDFDQHICTDIIYAKKGLLPKWYRDYVWECFGYKTTLKGGDPVKYALSKGKINSLYGMCVQHPVKPTIEENYKTGEYEEVKGQDLEGEYNKYCKRFTTILPYQWGVYVTAYAQENLFKLGACVDTWIYSDTDSCYGIGWDEKKVQEYNNNCIEMLKKAGYNGIEHNGRMYYPGVAEHETGKDDYTEFVTLGAKRYCGRNAETGKLKITVAGVPKKNGALCLKDDIRNFKKGMIFPGTITGKKTHTYLYKEEIYIDPAGNETGDSIDLSPCDYLLNAENDIKLEDILHEQITMQVYDEE